MDLLINRDNTFTLFYNYYHKIWGERWEELFSRLQSDSPKVLRPVFNKGILQPCNDSTKELSRERDDIGLLKYYVMDEASILPAKFLEVADGEMVLDMCAAPGGKSLVLVEGLPTKGEIILNEPSRERRERLMRVIRDYVPKEIRSRVQVLGKDGLRYGMMSPASFDKILVDAPCSGERHLINDSQEMKNWGPKRSSSLEKRQYGLLCSALLAAKSGGWIVYSTCSIAMNENDGVIERLLEKKADQFSIDLPESIPSGLEKTKHGLIALPLVKNWGPLYFTRLKKR